MSNINIEDTTISESLSKPFNKFIRNTSAETLSHFLRSMLVEYITNKHDDLPIRFHQYFEELSNLFELLDRINQERRSSNPLDRNEFD
jgi:hypothetical protein